MKASLSLLGIAAVGPVTGQLPLRKRYDMNGTLHDCPLAGPDFPPPSHLSNSSLLAGAIAGIEALLAEGPLGSNDTAFGVAVFSARENKTLYERYYTPPIDVGVKEVNRDSIFRIASISKVFTVWSFLIEAGDGYFNDPVTKYVPELANLTSAGRGRNSTVVYDDINDVRWEEVTLGNLASQAAGIARDATLGDLSPQLSGMDPTVLGLPTLDQDEVPVCGALFTQPACTRQQFLSYLLKQHPIFAASHSPAYSNIAFTLLAYALEAITGKDIDTTITTGIFNALGMQHSSYTATPSTGGVIPGDPLNTSWTADLGVDSPGASVYMSTGDMVKAGMAILQSTLLSPAQTRRWLKPHIQTGNIGHAVGAPWEIAYMPSPNRHLSQYFTKEGDLGAYHCAMILSPEREIGWVVLTAGADLARATLLRASLMSALETQVVPAAEAQARLEAGINFNGTYVDEATNSTVTLAAGEDGRAGIALVEAVARGVEVIGGVGQGLLYPTQLRTVSRRRRGGGTYTSRLGFRGVYYPGGVEGTIEDPCVNGWASLGWPLYGQRTLDDVVFELDEHGRATVLDFRALRLKLRRQE